MHTFIKDWEECSLRELAVPILMGCIHLPNAPINHYESVVLTSTTMLPDQ